MLQTHNPHAPPSGPEPAAPPPTRERWSHGAKEAAARAEHAVINAVAALENLAESAAEALRRLRH
jgi:hypothetical protein